ncbi:3-hydroxyisobutyryl-CoA hydrolase, mitochondrial-like isoform X1 [Pomacea canaliculata]|nr:3-hydroxyisobutyryl-CoA hydrolase, mitochondrial-like isoform X1 [Pomacea canaliculata]XP_025082432.1 3-hydroxyisobutyryl-CoA hydrolase, mitochondrial-like isoform X1 [Pomacea canaliculata]
MFSRSLRRLQVVLQHMRVAHCSNQTGDDVVFQAVRDKRIIILNRPKALNALNLSMIQKIYPSMVQWEDNADVSLVLIKGAGEKAFCAGGDVRAVTESGKTGGDLARNFFKAEYILNYKIGTYRKPYIAIIDGITMGGGVGLSVHGKFRVATERTVFAMPETAIGLFPDVGGGYFLPRLEGKLGMFLALTGFRLTGRDVFLAGIATHFVPSEKLSSLEEKLMALEDPTDTKVANVLDRFHHENFTEKGKPFVLASHMETINKVFEAETVEEILQKLAADNSEFAQKHLATLKKMSPTSMKVTFRQLQMGKKLKLADELQMEYRLSQRCLEDHDFYEGVRAVLVDKDQNPKWNPATLQEVTDDKLNWYFSPLPPENELHL